MSNIFLPLDLGDLSLPHRLIEPGSVQTRRVDGQFLEYPLDARHPDNGRVETFNPLFPNG
jgi:hypothetical protein